MQVLVKRLSGESVFVCTSNNETAGMLMAKLNYTSKPKHKKHVNKKVKLACLSHYQVTGEGKVERLRKTCTNPKCGVACFLAQHKDRLTCGKCHTHIPRSK
ncbi:40S ribosomal protein S27a [Entamoeba marina]